MCFPKSCHSHLTRSLLSVSDLRFEFSAVPVTVPASLTPHHDGPSSSRIIAQMNFFFSKSPWSHCFITTTEK